MTKRLGSAAVLAAATLALAGCGVNTIPTQEEAAKARWADVQSDYQRRADLIPNLVATVQGYAAQERGVLTDVIKARASATQVQVSPDTVRDPAKFQKYQQAQGALSGALGRLLVVSERYPDLKSNQNFLALQSQLEGTENRITVARRDYNGAVQAYNTTLHTFPGVLWAGTIYHNEKPMQLFQASSTAQSAPTVNFNVGAPGSAPPPASSSTTSTTSTTTSPSPTAP